MASEAPRTLFCWPGLTSNLLGSGTLNPGGGLNSGVGGSGAEVAAVVSGWALTTAREAALAARAVAVAVAPGAAVARRGRRRGVRWCSAVGAAGGAMDWTRRRRRRTAWVAWEFLWRLRGRARRGDEAIGVASGLCQWSGWARSPTVIHRVATG